MKLQRKDLRRTLRLSVLDGAAYSVMVGAGETYFVPWAIVLGASNLVLGLLVAFPMLVGSLSQLFSERLLKLAGSRKRFVVTAVALQALTFTLMVAVGLWETGPRGEFFLVVVCLYWIFQLVGAPAWTSLMGDVVPERIRGAYFGRRSRVVQLATFGAMVAAGLVLTDFRRRGWVLGGFTLVFAVSAVARLFSMGFIAAHAEPPRTQLPARRTLHGLVETLKHPAHRRLVLYLSSMSLAVYVSAPFFAVYMLRVPANRGLGWSYATFTLVTGLAVFSKFVFLPLWGRALDRFGARRCLVLSGWLIFALPLPWLAPASHPVWHLAIVLASQVWSGLAWAGHELSAFAFLLESAPPEDRSRLVSVYNVLNGAMLFVGASAGALLVDAAPLGVNPFLLVFVVSSALRLVVVAAQVGGLKEVRAVEPITYGSLLFRVVSVRPQAGALLRFFSLPQRRR